MDPQAANFEKLRVAVVEDARQMRESLAFLIKAAQDMLCVAALASAEEALEKLPSVTPDIVLLDIDLAGEMNGVDAIKNLLQRLPKARIVMLTASQDAATISRCLARGATGYLHKSLPPERLPQSIRDAAAGGGAISADVARLVCGFFQAIEPALQGLERLSPREQEVLKLLAKGFVKKEIADHLHISLETVRSHTANIYEKLQVHSRGDAVAKAVPLATLDWLKPGAPVNASTRLSVSRRI